MSTENPLAPDLPLAVDLDGTLIHSDLFWESVARLFKQRPLALARILLYPLKGRAWLKREFATRANVDVSLLPYNRGLVGYLRDQKAGARPIFLSTASDRILAQAVSNHLGLFDEVMASDGTTNLRGSAKAELLVGRFGSRGFDYAGDSGADLKVWSHARSAVLVNASRSFAARVQALCPVRLEFRQTGEGRLRALIRALRPHQWAKNLIVLVPLLTSHQFFRAASLTAALKAVAAFCLCASGVYLCNDLCDLDSDRGHSAKQDRSLAKGTLPVWWALLLAPALILLGFGAAALASWSCLAVLAVYVASTLAYSWKFKEVPIVDVFVLATLYTLRLIAGHLAAGIEFSTWLLAFSIFIFLSLALAKRYQELLKLRDGHDRAAGRGYYPGDLALIMPLGVASGYMAVLVLALYVDSAQVLRFYRHPYWLLSICPFFLYWISRVWMYTHRGKMDDDPVLFALRDRQSYLIGAIVVLVIILAS